MQTETADVAYLKLAAMAYGAGSIEEREQVAKIVEDWCADQMECVELARRDLEAGDIGAAAEIIGSSRRWTPTP